ncbi:unnamed protein product [Candida verbasci]|uniref:Zinc finger C2H2 LYAR-type domain-containing protein n=1 Tax=Candida verbasci TaxID=1227364 RepID=A0A9W4TSB9_9ASCO|nr:unnamed protein product [Candida verbasci]
MVSFSCEVCNDTVIKKKLNQHAQRCHGAYFTCIDCSTTFHGNDHNNHTQCITEDEKYQKKLYKPKKQQKVEKKEIKPVEKPIVKKVEKKEKKSKTEGVSKYVDTESNLYKILKKVAKDKNVSLKDAIKELKINKEDGKLYIY